MGVVLIKYPRMIDTRIQKKIFHLTSVLTDRFPRAGAAFFNALLPPIVGNRFLVDQMRRQGLAVLRRVKKFEKILVIPDIHIGDALMMQAAVSAFRDFFPQARIDYIVKKSVGCLIEGNPDISNLLPVFTGSVFPSQSDIENLQKLVGENQYDLCYNCSPFFDDARLFPKGLPILNFLSAAPHIMRNDIENIGVNHCLFQCYDLPRRLLSAFKFPQRVEPLRGVPITLGDRAIEEAENFLKGQKIPSEKLLLFMNPDTASDFTRIPFENQVELLKGLIAMGGWVLLGTAFNLRGIEEKLIARLTPEEKPKVVFVPTSLSLDGYTALIDHADVFLSGDTGPLHMAAARKFSKSGKHKFRNKTSIISVFGATPANVSGYDSDNPRFLPANQDAPSKVYVSESHCRNVTCVNKMFKTCKTVKCFEVLDTGAILKDIQAHLGKTRP